MVPEMSWDISKTLTKIYIFSEGFQMGTLISLCPPPPKKNVMTLSNNDNFQQNSVTFATKLAKYRNNKKFDFFVVFTRAVPKTWFLFLYDFGYQETIRSSNKYM